MQWLESSVLLDVNSEKYSIDNSAGDGEREFVSTFMVFNVTMNDTGEYICRVSNIHGQQSATAHLEVQREFLM